MIDEPKPDDAVLGAEPKSADAVLGFQPPSKPFESKDRRRFDIGRCCGQWCFRQACWVMPLNHPAPVLGSGWGCQICNLPPDGALVALCDRCIRNPKLRLKSVVFGVLESKRRYPYADISKEEFDHDLSKHPSIDDQDF